MVFVLAQTVAVFHVCAVMPLQTFIQINKIIHVQKL